MADTAGGQPVRRLRFLLRRRQQKWIMSGLGKQGTPRHLYGRGDPMERRRLSLRGFSRVIISFACVPKERVRGSRSRSGAALPPQFGRRTSHAPSPSACPRHALFPGSAYFPGIFFVCSRVTSTFRTPSLTSPETFPPRTRPCSPRPKASLPTSTKMT